MSNYRKTKHNRLLVFKKIAILLKTPNKNNKKIVTITKQIRISYLKIAVNSQFQLTKMG